MKFLLAAFLILSISQSVLSQATGIQHLYMLWFLSIIIIVFFNIKILN